MRTRSYSGIVSGKDERLSGESRRKTRDSPIWELVGIYLRFWLRFRIRDEAKRDGGN